MQKKTQWLPSDVPRWEKFGAWLKKRRKETNLAQKDFAERANFCLVHISRIENGRSSTTKENALILGRAVGADDVTTLKMAGFDSAVMASVPKEISDLLRAHGNKLSDDDFVLIADFVVARSKRNLSKTKSSEI